MPTLAVRLTDLNKRDQETKQGILVTNPQVGHNCLIYLGGQQYLRIHKVQGWIGPANGGYIIIFDGEQKRYRIEVIGSSDDFLL